MSIKVLYLPKKKFLATPLQASKHGRGISLPSRLGGLKERRELPQCGLWQEPRPKNNLVYSGHFQWKGNETVSQLNATIHNEDNSEDVSNGHTVTLTVAKGWLTKNKMPVWM